jgi:flagellar hook protein FlgE
MSSSLNVIANNLANLNTNGYKEESLNFASIFNQVQETAGNGDPIQMGSGVQAAALSSNWTNGTPSSTGIASNMAIQGNGFFVIKGSNNQLSYTRAGDFTVNASGQLCASSGALVMGYPAVRGVVSTSGALSPISVDKSTSMPGVATTSFGLVTNLDSSATAGSTLNSPISAYDSLGTPQNLTIQYTNTAPNAWTYTVTLPTSATGGTGAPTVLSSGSLTFNSSGQLTSPTGSIQSINIAGLADGAAPMSLTWNLTDASGNPTITQLNAASASPSTNQNGYGVGTLTDYTVLSDGTVQGQFSNDPTLALGQVALASFANPQGLSQGASSDYLASFASGAAIIGQAGAGSNGTISGGTVENSNVDLSKEFSKMIVAQQGYEANAKVLTTLKQISQATIQMMS